MFIAGKMQSTQWIVQVKTETLIAMASDSKYSSVLLVCDICMFNRLQVRA